MTCSLHSASISWILVQYKSNQMYKKLGPSSRQEWIPLCWKDIKRLWHFFLFMAMMIYTWSNFHQVMRSKYYLVKWMRRREMGNILNAAYDKRKNLRKWGLANQCFLVVTNMSKRFPFLLCKTRQRLSFGVWGQEFSEVAFELLVLCHMKMWIRFWNNFIPLCGGNAAVQYKERRRCLMHTQNRAVGRSENPGEE